MIQFQFPLKFFHLQLIFCLEQACYIKS
jgi:hypothetical protein